LRGFEWYYLRRLLSKLSMISVFGTPPNCQNAFSRGPQEVLGRLPEGELGVRLAAVAQDDPKQVRPAAFAIGAHDRRVLAEIDLSLLARLVSIRRNGSRVPAARFRTNRLTL
jgi:hypothetical protein